MVVKYQGVNEWHQGGFLYAILTPDEDPYFDDLNDLEGAALIEDDGTM